MAVKNAFFQVYVDERATGIIIFPSEDGGARLELDEVTSYLEKKSLSDYDMKEISNAINFANEPRKVQIYEYDVAPIKETIKVTISDDKLLAKVRFYPPSTNGDSMSKEEIIKELNNEKVVFGIDDNLINHHLLNPKYCFDYVIARGKEPIEGANAYITYHFDPEIKPRPKLNEDGTVDFHQLDNINHVKKGQILATLTPEDPGTPGVDVCGIEIRPKKVTRTILRYGKNIKLTQDGFNIESEIDGHVTLEGDRVFVTNTYEVPADVDNSTGDIEYDGNIFIRGTVRTGFKVRATGNVEISGVVEAAEIHAGGNIVLRRGMQGMGRGMLISKGDIVAKFLENAIAVAEGGINADAVMHSRISAKGEIKILGKNGNLIGGHARSACLIEAKTIGTPMGTATVVEVGTDPKAKDKLYQMNKQIKEKECELEKLLQLKKLLELKKHNGTLDRAKTDLLFKTASNIGIIREPLERLKEESEGLIHSLEFNKNATVKVNGEIFPGVKVSISDDFILIEDIQHYCQFRKIHSEIKMTPL